MADNHKNIFTQQMVRIATKTKGKFVMTEEQRSKIINDIKTAKTKIGKQRTTKDYRKLSRFDILSVQGVEKLIERASVGATEFKYAVAVEELYDLMRDKHVEMQHSGRDRMIQVLNKRFCNVTREAIQLFLSHCPTCQLKKKKAKKGLVVKPIVSNELNSRCQVDLIDMQSQAVDFNGKSYKFILNYQDHLTKFVMLRALTNKTASEVAYHLKDIFSIFGAPHILQSDNGREFTAHVINELVKQWPGCKLVHGKPRHSQSQGSVERANQDVQDMVFAWTMEHQNSNWVQALPEVQFAKNRSLHRGIGRSPFKATFGIEPRLGLSTSQLPSDVQQNVHTEEEFCDAWGNLTVGNVEIPSQGALADNGDDSALDGVGLGLCLSSSETEDSDDEHTTAASQNAEEFIEEEEEEEDGSRFHVLQTASIRCCVCENPSDGAHSCSNCGRPTHVICGYTDPLSEGYGSQVVCQHCVRQHTSTEERQSAKRSQQQQAERMAHLSNKRFKAADAGQSVVVAVPDLDRGRTDARNVMAVVMQHSDGFYTLGTRHGVLQRKYVRSEITPCAEKFLAENDVPQQQISLREAASKESLSGGQGYAQCNCTTNCQTNRCSCKAKGQLCKSACHRSSSCCNK